MGGIAGLILSRRHRPRQPPNNAFQRQTRDKQAFCAQNAAVSRITARARAFSRVCLGSMASRCIHAPHLQRIRALRKACISAPQGQRYTTSTGPTSLLAISAPPLSNHPHPAEDAPHAPACHFLQPSPATGTGVAHHTHRLITRRPPLLHADHLRVMGPRPSSRPPARRSAPRHRITLPRPFSPALGACSLSTVATTQGMQILACPALQSPPCRSICVRAMIYPPPSPPARKRLGAHPLEIHCHRPLSPPAADMQTCGEHAARTAWLCRITHHIKNPQPAPSLENALSCGYDAQRRIRRFM